MIRSPFATLRRLPMTAALVLCAVAVTACEPAATVARRDTPPISVAALGPSTAGMADLVNAERRARGLAPLRRDRRLRAAATGHAADMGTRGFFDHHGSDGGDHGARIAARGFRACVSGENIAWGQRSATEVVRGWMNSPGHKRVILHPRVTSFGAGFHPQRRQWVMVVAGGC